MNRKKQDLLLGLVFFVGLGGLLAATLLLTDLQFGSPPSRTIRFDDGYGLESGNPVFVRGLRLGRVASVRPVDEEVEVVVEFSQEVALYAEHRVRIVEGSFLGGRQVEIDPGTTGRIVPAETMLRGTVRAGALSALSEMLEDRESTVAKLLQSSELYEELIATVESARRSVEQMESGEGPLGRLFWSGDIAAQLDNIVRNVDTVAARLERGDGLLGRILTDEKLSDDAAQFIADLRQTVAEAREGKGPLGAILNDEKVAAEVRAITEGLALFISRANDPEAGLIGELVAGSSLREKALAFMEDVEAVADELRHGDGVLPRLINDPDLGEQFDRTLAMVTRAVEDAREAAPIATFFQVVAGAF